MFSFKTLVPYLYILFVSSLCAAESCEITRIDPYSFSIKIKNKKVGVFGSLKPSDENAKKIKEAFGKFIKMDRSCSALEAVLKKVLSDEGNASHHSKRVYEHLVSNTKDYQSIAVSHSKADADALNQQAYSILSQGAVAKHLCPNLTNEIFKSLMLSPGPAVYHSFINLKDPVYAVESSTLLQTIQTKADLSWRSSRFENLKLSDSTLKELGAMESLDYRPTTEHLDYIQSLESSFEAKSFLTSFLRHQVLMFSYVKERNKEIVRNLASIDQNVALPIGHHQIRDLQTQLLGDCKAVH